MSEETFLLLFGTFVFLSSPIMIIFYSLFFKNNLSFSQKYSLIYLKFSSIHIVLLVIGFCLSTEMNTLTAYFIITIIVLYIWDRCNNKVISEKLK